VILLDSNIIIYLRDPNYGDHIVSQVGTERLDTCNIIVVEVLGYKGLESTDAHYFEQLFVTMKNHLLDEVVTREVIELRRTTSLQLPDAIIAGTARAHGLILWTHNIADFKDVPGLQLFDPIHNF
jgi:predicted nucleic acid-binding protein